MGAQVKETVTLPGRRDGGGHGDGSCLEAEP